ncbi:MAG TPA: hypothetical protein VHP36_02195 [Chitinispirillaceae bacterium]|nr:hypothetical protein [Chitinispirillaceae bacterium]
MKYLYSIVSFMIIFFSCGGPKYVEVNKLPKTYQCDHMEEICKEAREFEGKYSQMNKEEKEEFKTLLDTYQSQCNTALEQCQKSGK